MRTGFSPVVLAALLVVPPSASQAQAQQVPSLAETIEVAIVNVDVVVTDRDGNRVRDLTKDDFEILEDGRPQPLSHFAEYRDDATDGATRFSDGEPVAPGQARTLVLFLEPFRLQEFRVRPFVESLKTLVRETIRPGDAVSIVSFGTDARTWLEPTDDVATAEAVLDAFAQELIGLGIDHTTKVAHEVTALKQFEENVGVIGGMHGGVRLPPRSDESLTSTVVFSEAMWADVKMRRRVAALNAIVNGLAGVDGKKSLIVAAHRLGRYSGAEFYYAGGQAVLPPGPADKFDNRTRMRELAANANAAGVALYPIFPAGLDELPLDPDDPDLSRQILVNEMETRQEVARETGGLVTYGATEIVKLMPRVADDMSNYYSLGYRRPTSRVDEARKLSVRTKDRTLQVRARAQFVEKSDESRMKDRVLAAMYGVSRESPIEVSASIGDAKDAGRRGRKSIPISVHVPIAALTLVPQEGTEAGAFSVFVMTGGERGEVSDVTRRTQPFEIAAAQVEKASAGHFTYDLEVVMRDGADHVAIGVLDEVSKNYGIVRLTLPDPR